MNGDIEKTLEFDKIRGIIARYCVSGLGRSLATELKPLEDMAQIKRMLDICSEAMQIKVVNSGLPLEGLHDIRHLMEKAGTVGRILEPEELLLIASTTRVASNLKAFIRKIAERYPIVAEIIDSLITFPRLEEAISAAIGPEGNILDSASPLLSRIRRQLASVRDRVISLLESILHSPHYQTAIQENVVTLRNNRYVIPVKQGFRSSMKGVIQARSTSGVTLFMEPAGAVELNNQLRELAEQEIAEIRRILMELTEKVREVLPELETTVEILSELDLINAKASLSIKLRGTRPELNDRGYINLIQGRHPLLQIKVDETPKDTANAVDDVLKVVPIDLHIGNEFDTLVITGPNTGGKTVALKTIGLLTLMMQSGLHIPAKEGSEMSVFRQVFADIGDEQSIEQNLSTFSSHMTRIIRIVKNADRSSLVLLDELGAGTEPSEGAALGMAVLDFLHSSGARTIATTHHDSLKTHAYSKDGMENASVAFDLKTLSPTYELRIGMPGSSNALKIADRLGLPEEIVLNAKGYLGSEALEMADLISTVEGMQRDLEQQKLLAEEKTLSATKAQQEHERLLQQFKGKKREFEREALREASIIVQNTRRLVENTVNELRKEKASTQSIQRARKKLVEARKEIAAAIEPPPVDVGIEPAAGDLKLGDEVYIRSLNSRGVLISLPDAKGMVQVAAGIAKINVPLSEIRVPSKSSDSPVKKKASNVIAIKSSKKSDISSTLDLRGERAEDALAKVDKYLDDAALAGLESVSIVHGKGTGTLREVVAELLSDHPLVDGFRMGERDEGGSGVTIVKLRE